MTAAVFIALVITAPFAFLALVEKLYTPDPHLSDTEVDELADAILDRADAAGLTLDEYLDMEIWDAEAEA